MLFSYQDEIPEKNLYWKIDTRFDSKAWNDRVGWTIQTGDVYDSDKEVEWIDENVASGHLISISVWEDAKFKNSIRNFMLSPKNWKQQLIAYLGEEKANAIILDFALKVAKQVWIDAKNIESKKENESVDKAAKQFENNLKTGFYTPRKEEKKLDDKFDTYIKFPWNEKATKVEESKMENKIPSSIEIEDEYEKGLTIKTTVHFIDEKSIKKVAENALSRELNQNLQVVIDNCVKYIDFDVVVESDFINVENHYSYSLKDISKPKTVGMTFYKDLIKTFKFPKDRFDAFWRKLSDSLAEEFGKILRIAAIQHKEEVKPKNYVPVKFPLRVGTFKGTITFQLLEPVYNLFINNWNVKVDDLFSREANTLVKVEGTYDNSWYRGRDPFDDFLPLWAPFWEQFEESETKKVNYETFAAHNFNELIPLLQVNVFEKIVGNSNELEIAMKRVRESLLGLKKPQPKDTIREAPELLEKLEKAYLEATLNSSYSAIAAMKCEEAAKNPYYNPTKLEQLKKEHGKYKDLYQKADGQFYTALTRLENIVYNQ